MLVHTPKINIQRLSTGCFTNCLKTVGLMAKRHGENISEAKRYSFTALVLTTELSCAYLICMVHLVHKYLKWRSMPFGLTVNMSLLYIYLFIFLSRHVRLYLEIILTLIVGLSFCSVFRVGYGFWHTCVWLIRDVTWWAPAFATRNI